MIPATFINRVNRFLGNIKIKNNRYQCFIPNPGRLKELLTPNARIFVSQKRSDYRRTKYDLVLVKSNSTLVSIDSRIPNKIVMEAIEQGAISEFQGFNIDKKEPVFEDSRFDLSLRNQTVRVFTEIKSCTLVQDRVAIFPDAPTKRGRKHVYTLLRSLKTGRAAMLFVIQRSDAWRFQANEQTDPHFSEALREAAARGVEIYVYTCKVTLKGISINKPLIVTL